MKVTIYTDGAARGNPDGPGGFGTVIHYVDPAGKLHTKEISGGYKRTTNNRMELMAAIAGLEALNRPARSNSIQIPSISLTLLTSTGSRVGSKRAGNAAKMRRLRM